MKRYPTVLTIAGSDSGGGAGIQADLKTITTLGAYGASVLTALTAQNTQGVRGIHPVPPDFVRKQLEAVFEDIKIDSVKIGMVNTLDVARVIAKAMDLFKPNFVVFDPVMMSTSGAKLIQDETINLLWKELFPLADLITPNIDEASVLTGRRIDSVDEMKKAAEEMVMRGCKAVLLKGGHLTGPVLFDVFAKRGDQTLSLETPYIETTNIHGTGCTLSSAIATFIAKGFSLPEAIDAGKAIQTGQGPGPLNHSFAPLKMETRS